LGRYDEALACYDRALAINPSDLDILKRRQTAESTARPNSRWMERSV
jgi:tetratricopeptide (TPR) repeat protein